MLLVLFVAAATTAAHAQTQVFVPGNASGYFGNPVDQMAPFVLAITVDGPGTVTVTYVSGTVDFVTGVDVGPNGVTGHCAKIHQLPLQEANGVAKRELCKNNGGLIGVFVPQSRVLRKGFNALDGTKNVTQVGIMPGNLFFIGEAKTFDVKEAGTLYLGINDTIVSDNTGGFTVEVTGP